MTYVITAKCERCGTCVEVCPSDAIFYVEEDADWPTYYIYAENCIDCAACEVECESEAIYYEDDVPEEDAGATERNASFFGSGPGSELV
jgi:ferredoxin